MSETTKCLNEWNATIEALGQGKQTILIRKYGTNLKEFLFYPTGVYTKNEDILNSFKDNAKEFVKNNLFPIKEGKLSKINYYAKVEEIIRKPPSEIDNYSKFHIWTNKHVKEYLTKIDARIWILRVYKLDEPQTLKKGRGMRYANVEHPVKLEGKPVIGDTEFEKLKEEILTI